MEGAIRWSEWSDWCAGFSWGVVVALVWSVHWNYYHYEEILKQLREFREASEAWEWEISPMSVQDPPESAATSASR